MNPERLSAARYSAPSLLFPPFLQAYIFKTLLFKYFLVVSTVVAKIYCQPIPYNHLEKNFCIISVTYVFFKNNRQQKKDDEQ